MTNNLGETQEVVAQRAGIAIPTLSMIEGGNSNPTWATVRDIAAALGISMGNLAKLADKFADAENETEMRLSRPGTPWNCSEGHGT